MSDSHRVLLLMPVSLAAQAPPLPGCECRQPGNAATLHSGLEPSRSVPPQSGPASLRQADASATRKKSSGYRRGGRGGNGRRSSNHRSVRLARNNCNAARQTKASTFRVTSATAALAGRCGNLNPFRMNGGECTRRHSGFASCDNNSANGASGANRIHVRQRNVLGFGVSGDSGNNRRYATGAGRWSKLGLVKIRTS